MKIVVKMEKSCEGCFRAWCPALPGCRVVAESRGEAARRIDAAIRGYIASLNVALPRELQEIMQTA